MEKVTRESLLLAIEHLTDLQRHVITLKFGAGLSNAEVAVVLGRTEGAVKALQHAASYAPCNAAWRRLLRHERSGWRAPAGADG